MKQTLFIFISFLFILSACGPSAEEMEKAKQDLYKHREDSVMQEIAKQNAIIDFTKSFEGTINGKYGIIMTLAKSGNDLSGTYMYKSQNSSLKLKGNIDSNGNLSLNEFDNKGSMTGTFKGQLSGGNILGQWSKPDGSKTMPFSVTESSNTEAQLLKEKTESDFTGTYEDNFGNTIEIKGPAKDGAITFTILVATEGCAGDISGIAYLSTHAVANYSDNTEDSKCHLNFTFNEGTVEVMEYDCQNYHGARCGFSGSYKKK